MPLLGNQEEMQVYGQAGNCFQFSAVKLTHLQSVRYTLVTIAVDRSGSIQQYEREIEQMIGNVIDACRKSPMADSLLVRVTQFDNTVEEIHGYKQLIHCAPGDYANVIQARGMTALYDATIDAMEATLRYGKDLVSQQFEANGLVVIITDGAENKSTYGMQQLSKLFAESARNEELDSLLSILVGINCGLCQQLLEDFAKDAGFSQFVPTADASVATLARLANFISRSVSSQSQSLASKGPSTTLTF